MKSRIILLAGLVLACAAHGAPPDTDGDGVPDALDNCRETPNAAQVDSDGDLCGNRCDADYDQDGAVGALDFLVFRACFAGPALPVCDHAPDPLDGIVSILDFGVFQRQYTVGVPGPGLNPRCNGKRSP